MVRPRLRNKKVISRSCAVTHGCMRGFGDKKSSVTPIHRNALGIDMVRLGYMWEGMTSSATKDYCTSCVASPRMPFEKVTGGSVRVVYSLTSYM